MRITRMAVGAAAFIVSFTGMINAAFGADFVEHDVVGITASRVQLAAAGSSTVTVVALVPRCTRPSAVKAVVYQNDGSAWVTVISDPSQATARKCKLQGLKKWATTLNVTEQVAAGFELSYGLNEVEQ